MSRFKEPSTFAGFGLITVGIAELLRGVSQVVDFDEGPEIADAIQAAEPAVSSGNWPMAIGAIVTGGLAIVMREFGNK